MTPLPQLHVAVDIGSQRHRVAVGLNDGQLLDEFDVSHNAQGFKQFFLRIDQQAKHHGVPVSVAMEGYNGWARPLDQQVLHRGYRLFNVNNLKFARFKEIFPGNAKTDVIDGRKMLELFQLRHHLPLAKDVLQEVAPVPVVNTRLKRLTRRRKQLIKEKVALIGRMTADLQALSPGLLSITGQIDNLWFLRFLTARDTLAPLARLRHTTLLGMAGIGKGYAAKIQAWQHRALFAEDEQWAGPMVIEDANRLLVLLATIKALQTQIEVLSIDSRMAARLSSLPGFGAISCAELAGEIGHLGRFKKESSLALYVGMAALDHSSGKHRGSKQPKQVNTRAKAALMIAIVRHMACVPASRRYYDKKRAQGKKHNQAVRALGRHLVRVIWSMLKHDRDYEVREEVCEKR